MHKKRVKYKLRTQSQFKFSDAHSSSGRKSNFNMTGSSWKDEISAEENKGAGFDMDEVDLMSDEDPIEKIDLVAVAEMETIIKEEVVAGSMLRKIVRSVVKDALV